MLKSEHSYVLQSMYATIVHMYHCIIHAEVLTKLHPSHAHDHTSLILSSDRATYTVHSIYTAYSIYTASLLERDGFLRQLELAIHLIP